MTTIEKALKRRKTAIDKMLALPTIAMCEWEQFNPNEPEKGKFTHRSQVIKITKRSVVMRAAGSSGAIVTLSSTPGWNVFDFVKIEKMPCDTREYSRIDDTMKEYLARGTTKCKCGLDNPCKEGDTLIKGQVCSAGFTSCYNDNRGGLAPPLKRNASGEPA